MNKIIVVGHPQSGLEKVEELLLACGMAQALPSCREGFTPGQISTTLLKAHGVLPVQQVRSADELQQIAVAPVWQGLALDLVLANMDQSLWGWADTQAVYLLDYWKTQDPQTMFVLVYDTPQSALTRHAVDELETDPEALQAKVNAWMAYNAALLSFHLRNTERSFLVHADQVQTAAPHYLQQLSARIDIPLQLPGVSQREPGNTADATEAGNNALPVPQEEAAIAVYDKVQVGQVQDLHGNALAQWLAQQLLEEHPEVGELYAQLQAAASMPLRTQQQGQALLAAHGMQQRYQAWTAFVAQQTAIQQSAARLAQLPKVLADLKAAQEKAEKLQQAVAKPASTELEEENELLLTQLHKVQEELERYYLENRQLKAGGAVMQPAHNKKTYYGAADRIKQQLSYRLGATMIAQSRSIGGWLGMPFALRAEAKRFKQDQAARAKQKLPPIAQYRDAHEAERVKRHLSYRLGARMIANSKTLGGWISMPWVLLAEAKAFERERQARS